MSVFVIVLRILLVGLALFTLIAAVLPLSASNAWWIRALNMPRIQAAVFAAVGVVAVIFLLSGWWLWVGVAMFGAALAVNAVLIVPYFPLYPVEMRAADSASDEVTILVSNVQMGNENHDTVLSLIEEVDPDILLLLETDQTWIDAMEPALVRYDTVVREPRDNYYGMTFATRLPSTDARIAYLTTSDTPSLFAELQSPGGQPFRFVGLHPRPPVPGQDTEERDAQLLYSARFAQESDIPVVVAGDLNAAAWSRSSRRFKHVGGYLDPRQGRGPLSSFDARSRLLRLPIDQIYLTRNIALVSMDRGPDIGSDHFPLITVLRVDPELARGLNDTVPPLAEDEEIEVRDKVNGQRERLREAGVLEN